MSKIYDPNKDYMEEMKKHAATGNESGFNAAQTARNAKIAGEKSGYATTNYKMADFAKQNGIGVPAVPKINTTPVPIGTNTATIPGVRVQNNAPAMIGNYAFDTDFQAMIDDAIARGDFGSAKMFENLRNQKLSYMNSPYSETHVFNYNDPYRGQMERMREDIQNREAFEYDYRNDPQYKALRALKEREARKAYNDGYGEMSKQFEGGVPVAMINKLIDTREGIEAQADNYIPQLKQMAYEMYMNEGDQMMRNYAMMQDAANQDYNRWTLDRDMYVSGKQNAYDRGYGERAYAKNVADSDRNYKRSVYTDDRNYERSVYTDDRNWNYAVDQDAKQRETGLIAANNDNILALANEILKNNKGMSEVDAIAKAKEMLHNNGMWLE